MPCRPAIVLILGLAAACNMDVSGRASITAEDLAAAYARSSAAVRNRYDGKELGVAGVVIAKPEIPHADGREGSVVIGRPGSVTPILVKCRFTSREFARFADIEAGQYVTVSGVFSGEQGPELRFCRLAGLG